MDEKKYKTDLTQSQWEKISQYIPRAKTGRKIKYQLREIINGILYIVHTGCQWRMLPNDFPPYYSVYYHFRKWKKDETWFLIHQGLHQEIREKSGKQADPTGAIIDTQSVKASPMAESRGFDGHKKVKNRPLEYLALQISCIYSKSDSLVLGSYPFINDFPVL